MSAVSESIVREYFELHGFFVRQHRKYVAPSRKDEEEDEIDFFICNPRASAETAAPQMPFVLASSDLALIQRAIVVVKGWHTETFSMARLTNSPEIFRFVQPKAFQQAAQAFGEHGRVMKVLVIPALPRAAQARNESIEMLKAKGLDAVIPFWTMLADLVNKTEANRNYQKSDLLQTIRVLKAYDLIKEPQLELFKAARRRNKS